MISTKYLKILSIITLLVFSHSVIVSQNENPFEEKMNSCKECWFRKNITGGYVYQNSNSFQLGYNFFKIIKPYYRFSTAGLIQLDMYHRVSYVNPVVAFNYFYRIGNEMMGTNLCLEINSKKILGERYEVLTPELGFIRNGWIISYGYNFSQKKLPREISSHRVSLKFNLAFFFN